MRRTLPVSLLLVLITAVAYIPVRGHGFITYDDSTFVTENAAVQSGLSWANVAWAFSPTAPPIGWHPLTWLSHMLDCQLFGPSPLGPHLVNLGLHLANTVLLLLALRALTGAFWPSALVAALFALHPLHVESVAWVAERKDVLSMFFAVLTLWLYAGYAQRRTWVRYLLVAAAFALSLLAKPMMVTLPLVMLLLDYWPLRRLSPQGVNTQAASPGEASWWRRALWLVLEKVPLLALSAGASVLTVIAQDRGGTIRDLSQISMAARLVNVPLGYVRYLGKTFWPRGLSFFYPFRNEWPWQFVAGAIALLVVISVVALWQARRRPYVLVGWLWFLGTLVPVIGLVQVGSQSIADRYTYLPLTGLFIILAWGSAELWRRWPVVKEGGTGFWTAVLTLLATLTWTQAGHWKDSRTLFTYGLAVDDRNHIAHDSLACVILQEFMDGPVAQPEERLAEAERHLRRAVELAPIFGGAHSNLGLVLCRRGQFGEAVEHLSKAVAMEPTNAGINANLGLALLDYGQPAAAMHYFATALRLDPNNADAYHGLGQALTQQQRDGEAVQYYAQAIRLRPDFVASYVEQGKALIKLKRLDAAAAVLRQAVRLAPPQDHVPHQILGAVLWNMGRLDEARREYEATLAILQQAVQRAPRDPRPRYVLGAVLQDIGHPDEARRQFETALRLQPDYAPARQALERLTQQ